MSIPITIGLYFVLWWVLLFAVLPWGVRSQHEEEGRLLGTDPGAPIAPMMWRKALWTTVITAIVVGLIYVLVTYRVISV